MSDTRTLALNLAMNFIKVYVIRGDSIEELQRGCMSSWGDDGKVSIGGYYWGGKGKWVLGKKLTKLKADEIVVEQVGSRQCSEVFKLIEVFEAVEQKYIPAVAAIKKEATRRELVSKQVKKNHAPYRGHGQAWIPLHRSDLVNKRQAGE
jgi:hypothetical protein